MSLSDVRTPAVPIQAAALRQIEVVLDKPRRLCYDLNALAILEEKYGDLDKALAAFKTSSPRALRDLLHAGLVHEDKALTVEDVGALFTMANIQALSEQISAAVKAGLPAPDPNAKRPPETVAPEGSTGPGSATSDA